MEKEIKVWYDQEGDYLEVLFDSLLFKDVVKRHRVKFSTQIGNLGSHLINNFSNLYTVRKLLDVLNLKSASTTEKYIKYPVSKHKRKMLTAKNLQGNCKYQRGGILAQIKLDFICIMNIEKRVIPDNKSVRVEVFLYFLKLNRAKITAPRPIAH